MKKFTPLFLGLTLLTTAPLFAQTPEKLSPANVQLQPPSAARRLTHFDLDFPGGTPKELVAAVQKGMGRPLNAIIPTDLAEWKLPPMKMTDVDAPQLFRALEQAGHSKGVMEYGNGSASQYDSTYGFRTATNPGAETDDSIWYFFLNGAPTSVKVSRFYYLAPYLETGLTVDDITTAIKTGWKMRGDTAVPTLSFHKETKLLIAVGDYVGLNVIESVLKALDAAKSKSAEAKSGADPKTKQ